MSVFSSGKRSSTSKRSSLSTNSSNFRPSLGRAVNTDKEKAVQFALLLKKLDVKSVLQNVYQEQEQKDYDVLIRTIREADSVVKDAELLKLLTTAKDSVQYLNEKLKLFVQVLLAFKWYTRNDKIVKAYSDFVLQLCKHQPVYIELLTEQLIKVFTKVTEPSNNINTWKDGFPPDPDAKIFKNVHKLINSLLVNSCITSEFLVEKLWNFYPHFNLASGFLCYTHNLLEMSLYVDTNRKQIFNLIIQRLVCLDTLATQSEIDRAESDYEEQLLSSAEIFNMEEDSLNSDNNGPVMRHPVANLLDICLLRFFKYIQNVCFDRRLPTNSEKFPNNTCELEKIPHADKKSLKKNNTSTQDEDSMCCSKVEKIPDFHLDNLLVWDKCKVLFNELLSVFESTILPTYGITHVQFLIFYFCSFKMNVGESFIEFLWKKITNVKIYNIFRQSCCNYVSSLLIHAHFMPVRVIKTCLNEMTHWLHEYIDSVDLTDEESCVSLKHAVFYSVAQAVLSVIAYKHLILVETKKNLKFLHSLNLQRIIMSHLNPLRSCNQDVVAHFAFITKKYQIVYCYNVMHQNARLNVLPILNVDHMGNVTKLSTYQTLDQYSPFSLFLLLRCKSFITSTIHCEGDPVEILNPIDTESSTNPDHPVQTIQMTKSNTKDDDDDYLMSVDAGCPGVSMLNMSISV